MNQDTRQIGSETFLAKFGQGFDRALQAVRRVASGEKTPTDVAMLKADRQSVVALQFAKEQGYAIQRQESRALKGRPLDTAQVAAREALEGLRPKFAAAITERYFERGQFAQDNRAGAVITSAKPGFSSRYEIAVTALAEQLVRHQDKIGAMSRDTEKPLGREEAAFLQRYIEDKTFNVGAPKNMAPSFQAFAASTAPHVRRDVEHAVQAIRQQERFQQDIAAPQRQGPTR
jgi:hypothetical protein